MHRGHKEAARQVARRIGEQVGGPAALARFLHRVAATWPAPSRALPPLWRLLATPRRLGLHQIRRMPPNDLVRLHSLPDMIASHAAAGSPLEGATDVHRLWSRLGLADACLRALERVSDSLRSTVARELLEGAGAGLSNRALDRLLGIDVDGVAMQVLGRIEHDPELDGKWCWQESDADVTQTRYEDLVALARSLGRREHIVDLGSGFGRLGLVLGLLRPDVRFTGLEIVRERVVESTRVTRALDIGRNVRHEHADLEYHPVPVADSYFLFFSFPTQTASHVLRQLRDIARTRPISIIVHGMWPGQELGDVPWLRPAPAPEPFCRFVSVDPAAHTR